MTRPDGEKGVAVLKPWRVVAVVLAAAVTLLLVNASWRGGHFPYGLSSLPAEGTATPAPTGDFSLLHSDTTLVVGSGEVDVEGGILPLLPRIPGQVQEILVEEGQQVRRNAPLLRLRGRAAEIQVTQA